MADVIAYTFDYSTGAYTGARRLGVGDVDARAGNVLLVPGNATLIAPPRCSAGLWPFWRNGQWEVFEMVEKPDQLPIDNDYWANCG